MTMRIDWKLSTKQCYILNIIAMVKFWWQRFLIPSYFATPNPRWTLLWNALQTLFKRHSDQRFSHLLTGNIAIPSCEESYRALLRFDSVLVHIFMCGWLKFSFSYPYDGKLTFPKCWFYGENRCNRRPFVRFTGRCCILEVSNVFIAI